MASQIVNEVVTANNAYAANFGSKGDLALPPARGFAILTCMDARLDPAKYAGLSEGDAHVIRNAGGRASDDAIRSLVISHKLLGTREWFVIHHTNCGMELFCDEVMGDLLEDNLSPPRSTCRRLRMVEPAAWRRLLGGPFHQMAHDRESGRQRRAGRRAHPFASARAEKHSDLRLHLRCEDRQDQRGHGSDQGRQGGVTRFG